MRRLLPMGSGNVRGSRAGSGGFTLLETLLALTIAAVFLFPLGAWLYRSHTSRHAAERLCAVGALERALNRAFLLREEKDRVEDLHAPCAGRLEVRARGEGDEVRLTGVARDLRGRELARLEMCYFRRRRPP